MQASRIRISNARKAEILGKLTWAIAVMLAGVWVLGNLLLPNSSGISAASAATDSVGTESGSASAGNVNALSNSAPNVRHANAQPAEGVGELVPTEIDGRLRTLATDNQQLIGKIDSMATKVDQNSRAIAEIQTANGRLSQAVADQRSDLTNQIAKLESATARDISQIKQQRGGRVSADAESNMQRSSTEVIAKPRVWTMTSGGTATAVFAGVDGSVVLLRAKGKTFRVPLGKLIDADQQFVQQMAE